MRSIACTLLLIFLNSLASAQIQTAEDKVIQCGIQPNVVAISPDGNTVLVGGSGKKVRVYDVNSGKELLPVVVQDVFGLNDIKYAPDGRSFAVAGDQFLMIFDTRSYNPIYTYKTKFGEFTSISFSPDSKQLVGSFHEKVGVWDLRTYKTEVLPLPMNKFMKVAWSPAATEIAIGDINNNICLWNIAEQSCISANYLQKDLINCFSFNNYGTQLYSCSSAGFTKIYDVIKKESVQQLVLSQHDPTFVGYVSPGFIITGGEDGRLIYWKTDDYKPVILSTFPGSRVLSGSISSTTNKIVLGLSDKTFHVLRFKNDDLALIKNVVIKKTKCWQQQGKYEKSTDYLLRVNDSARAKKVDYYTQWTIDSLGQAGKRWALRSTDYDADNESFKLIFFDFPPILIHVPVSEAESFDKSANTLQFRNQKFTLEGDNYILMHVDIANPENKKTYYYDKREAMAFNPEKLGLDLSPIEITLPDQENNESNSEITVSPAELNKISDVDQSLPQSTKTYKEAYALIIGNEDYTKYNSNLSPESNVPFARNDAKSFYNYAIRVLGIPAENIFYYTDAIGSVMRRDIEKLCKMANYREGKVDLFFYFAGHGLPDEETKDSYILPVDVNADNIRDGIKLMDIYRKFSSSKANRTIVIVDACFSGEGRNQPLIAARSVKIKPQEPNLEGNIVVFSAGRSDQRSLPYNQQKHGLFTYFFLKYLYMSKGSATLGDFESFLGEEVPITSIKLYGIEQTPQISVGNGIDSRWKKWTLKGLE